MVRPKREEYVIMQSIVSAVRSASTMFAFNIDDENEFEYSVDRLNRMGNLIADKVTESQLHNMMVVCEIALNRYEDKS